MYVINSERIPIFIWSEKGTIEKGAIDQLKRTASLPFVHHHIAGMADCHIGYGLPIGGVTALDKAISPSMVGYDISCGMRFLETNIPLSEINENVIYGIRDKTKRVIPCGSKHHSESQEWISFNDAPDVEVVLRNLSSAKRQLGTLGSGNHFIELQTNNKDNLCLMIHSGSRNFGHKVATYYMKKAEKLCDMWHSNIPKLHGDGNLAFLPIGSEEAKEYINAMKFCMKFAAENRRLMMIRVKNLLYNLVKKYTNIKNVEELLNIDVNHNYASLENHYGKNVWVHRKGATLATEKTLSVIPGSMGTNSYIVRGKNNEESFKSCSHGAGRRMSRNQANKELSKESVEESMKGVAYHLSTKRRRKRDEECIDLSEAPAAYKDIKMVMSNQEDLVDIIQTLKPVANVKG